MESLVPGTENTGVTVTSLVDNQLQARRLILAQATWITLVLLVAGLTGAGLLPQ
ncbi:MAG TPA: hypothetical protein VF177_22595 [Anaerolineae bacterium]